MAVSTESANDLFHALLRVQKLLLAARNAAPRVHAGVDSAAYPVLFVLASSGSTRVSDLATALHNDASTVSRQVTALANHGLVAKEADPQDGRAQVVSLSDEGREALRAIQANRSVWFQSLLAEWDGSDAASFTHQLHALGDALDSNLRARGETPPALMAYPPKED